MTAGSWLRSASIEITTSRPRLRRRRAPGEAVPVGAAQTLLGAALQHVDAPELARQLARRSAVPSGLLSSTTSTSMSALTARTARRKGSMLSRSL